MRLFAASLANTRRILSFFARRVRVNSCFSSKNLLPLCLWLLADLNRFLIEGRPCSFEIFLRSSLSAHLKSIQFVLDLVASISRRSEETSRRSKSEKFAGTLAFRDLWYYARCLSPEVKKLLFFRGGSRKKVWMATETIRRFCCTF